MAEVIDVETGEITPVRANVIESMMRAEVDIAITTAKQYPRDMVVFNDSVGRVISDPVVAAGCGYILPAGGKSVEGPSVRLAEIMAPRYHNMAVATRTIDVDATSITIQAVAKDYESNYQVSMEIKRQIVDKNGKRYSDNLLNKTIMAAQSIGFRNVVFRIVPKEYVDKFHRMAKEIATKDPEALLETREKWVAHFESLGVSRSRLLDHFKVAALKNLSSEDVITMQGYSNAIRDGETKLDDIFPPESAPSGEDLQSLMSKQWLPMIPDALGKSKLSKPEQSSLVRAAIKDQKSAEEVLALINIAIANKASATKKRGARKASKPKDDAPKPPPETKPPTETETLL